FMFKYPLELEIKECALLLNEKVAKTTNALFSPHDTRIKTELVPGTYHWRIECVDTSNQVIYSELRKLIIGEQEESELKISRFPDRDGFIYEFELKDNLEIDIKNVVPNDVIRVKEQDITYDMNILRVIQDYSTGIEFVELLISDGYKRIKLGEGDSTSIDFNNDGYAELDIILNDISFRKAFFTVSTEKQSSNIAGKALQEPAQTSQPLTLLEVFLAGLIIALIIAIIFVLKRRKEEEKQYLTELKEDSSKTNKPRKTKKKVTKKTKKTGSRKKSKK
ncbi:hypothetical protein KY341_06230, partial [Candidatus Woesearchaeota archaeon]|nr:hypothetical protein [Candidatus Woesearchaeota archaeon]